MTTTRLVAFLIAALAIIAITSVPALAQSKPKSKPAVGPKTDEKPKPTTPTKGTVHVRLTTSVGEMLIALNGEKAPKTVENFLHYTDTKYFDGTIFHRVMANFMVQGGGFVAEGIEAPMARPKKPTRAAVQNEADNGLKNEYGTIAMARTGDPHSGTSQFFINVKSNANLNHRSKDARGWGYCVFGKVVKGHDVLEKIRHCKVKPLPIMRSAKVLPDPIITIKSVRRMTKEEVAKEVK